MQLIWGAMSLHWKCLQCKMASTQSKYIATCRIQSCNMLYTNYSLICISICASEYVTSYTYCLLSVSLSISLTYCTTQGYWSLHEWNAVEGKVYLEQPGESGLRVDCKNKRSACSVSGLRDQSQRWPSETLIWSGVHARSSEWRKNQRTRSSKSNRLDLQEL